MKKNITVNIGGIIFHIDEDAYDQLELYLDNLKVHFQFMEGHDEVMADIENRIAEMFQSRITDERQVITLNDVNEVIRVMGQASEFESEAGPEAAPGGQSYGPHQKRLFRDPDNKIIGGICSGMAHYFHIDPLWLRLGFALSVFLGGAGLLVYIILWIFVPEALTTAEKLEMRGEKVNISNIEKSIREEFDGVKERMTGLKDEAKEVLQKTKHSGKNVFERLLSVFVEIITFFFRAFVILIGLVFITVGVFLIIGILISFFETEHIFYMSSFGISTFSIPAFLKLLFAPKDQTLAILGICLLLGIPLMLLIYTGVRLIFRFKSPSRFVGIPAFSLLVAGIVICIAMGVEALKGFSHKIIDQKTYTIKSTGNKPLFFDLISNDSIESIQRHNNILTLGNWNMLSTGDTNLFFGVPSLEFVKTEADSLQLILYTMARGENRIMAEKSAKKIIYHFTQKDTTLLLNPYFYLPEGEKYRSQSVKLVVRIPKGQVIRLSEKTIVFFDNSIHENSVDMSGKRWRMEDSGLKELPGSKFRNTADSISAVR